MHVDYEFVTDFAFVAAAFFFAHRQTERPTTDDQRILFFNAGAE